MIVSASKKKQAELSPQDYNLARKHAAEYHSFILIFYPEALQFILNKQ